MICTGLRRSPHNEELNDLYGEMRRLHKEELNDLYWGMEEIA